MASPFVRRGGWTIHQWASHGNSPGIHGIPDHGFQQGTVLLIGLEPERGGGDSYSLSWLNGALFLCSMPGITEDGQGELSGSGVATFGVNPVCCKVSLALQSKGPAETIINGQISASGGTTPTGVTPTAGGTFAATANPDPPAPGLRRRRR